MIPALLFASLVTLAEDAPQVRLIVSGRSGGVSAHPTRMLAPAVLAEHAPNATVQRVGFTAYERHGCYLFADDGSELPVLAARLRDAQRTREVVGAEDVAQSILDVTWDDAGGRWSQWLVGAAQA